MKLYILQYQVRETFSVVIGVYDSPDKLQKASDEWRSKDGKDVDYLFYDVKELNSSPDWTNDQSFIPVGYE